MFDVSPRPRVFGVPPGADFPRVLVAEILGRFAGKSPENLARVLILVNTRRMQRRLTDLFQENGPRLLPRIGLVTDVDLLLTGADLPGEISPLRRRLELTRLTTRLIEKEPDLASRTAAVDLADSLAALLDEMQGEGVAVDRLSDVDVGDESLHWERSLKFLKVAGAYADQISGTAMDREARRRAAIEQVHSLWQDTPPETPVIVAGSTGSRAATSILMRAVAGLPQGAVVLPGFDFDMPVPIWESLAENRDTEDHPQYRFAAILQSLGMERADVLQWGAPPDAARNKLISLSLRPAHVTDQWLSEGASLGELTTAARGISIIEAPKPKTEALAIAIAVRAAVEEDKKVALITTDRTLARRVAAGLARWEVFPDDSAGVPLSLTAPGRFLRQVARMIGKPTAIDEMVALLKHPLTRTGNGSADRLEHLKNTRAFELFVRDKGIVNLSPGWLDVFASLDAEAREEWTTWLKDRIAHLARQPASRLRDAIAHHIDCAESLAQGPGAGSGKLWESSSGTATQKEIQRFQDEAEFDGPITFADYTRLLESALGAESHREQDRSSPDVMIWGTLEARVQGAELVILGGLVEGQWPEQPRADPWLNRRMRRDLGLLLPEREVGLAAHDYQQAVAAPDVILSLAKRTDDSEAVPSRWLSRLTNLLNGLPEQNGKEALADMRARGSRFLDLAARLDVAENPGKDPAPRPAPAPPSVMRPKSLSVTELKTLVRDPYAIYGKHVLKLRPLNPLIPRPDGRLRGIVLHKVLEKYYSPEARFDDRSASSDRLSDIINEVFFRYVPWATTRVEWRAQMLQIADWLFDSEVTRRQGARLLAREAKGVFEVPSTSMVITGTADRIDVSTGRGLAIYDYKTGAVPSDKIIRHFDRQLLIEAVMAEAGAFPDVPATPVSQLSYVKIGRKPQISDIDLADFDLVTVKKELAELLEGFDQYDVGYVSRRAMEKERYSGDYDHLARHGEWDASQPANPERFS